MEKLGSSVPLVGHYAAGGTFGKQGSRSQFEGTRETLEKEMKALQSMQAKFDSDGSMMKQVQGASADREQTERQKKMAEEEAKRIEKGVAEADKFRSQSLEKYGTDREKLDARLARERNELADKTSGISDQAGVLSQFDKQSEVERAKLKLAEMKKEFAEGGNQQLNGAPGALRNSVEGIQAINRAVTGNSQKDVLQKQLQTAEEQLKNLEKIARDVGTVNKPPTIVKISG